MVVRYLSMGIHQKDYLIEPMVVIKVEKCKFKISISGRSYA
jgi:hypothetical protein